MRFFHMMLDEPRGVKIFQPNPIVLPDGTVHRSGVVEVTFFLHKVAMAKFETILPSEMRRLGLENAEFVERS